MVCAVSPCCRAVTCPLFDQTDSRKTSKALKYSPLILELQFAQPLCCWKRTAHPDCCTSGQVQRTLWDVQGGAGSWRFGWVPVLWHAGPGRSLGVRRLLPAGSFLSDTWEGGVCHYHLQTGVCLLVAIERSDHSGLGVCGLNTNRIPWDAQYKNWAVWATQDTMLCWVLQTQPVIEGRVFPKNFCIPTSLRGKCEQSLSMDSSNMASSLHLPKVMSAQITGWWASWPKGQSQRLFAMELLAKDGGVGKQLFPGQEDFQLWSQGSVLKEIELG